MELAIYQIDAFADAVFKGNPAAVCPLDKWLPDEILQSIAEENNLSETAFFVREAEHYHIRWFTPVTEVSLCGHATLASAYVLFNILQYKENQIRFMSKSGELKVTKRDEQYELDFPAIKCTKSSVSTLLIEGLGKEPLEVFESDSYIAVFNEQSDIEELNPDFNALKKLELERIIVTSPGKQSDFVSRFFAPKKGIDEDPVTGSAHCVLTPFWAKRLGKNQLSAMQLSKRCGKLQCELKGDRILIAGKAIKIMEGKVYLP